MIPVGLWLEMVSFMSSMLRLMMTLSEQIGRNISGKQD